MEQVEPPFAVRDVGKRAAHEEDFAEHALAVVNPVEPDAHRRCRQDENSQQPETDSQRLRRFRDVRT